MYIYDKLNSHQKSASLKMARFQIPSVLLGLAYFIYSCTAQNFYVVAPNTIRTGTEETVAITMDGLREQGVSVYLQHHPGRKKNISQKEFMIKPGETKIVFIEVLPEDVPDADFKTPNAKNYVILFVQSGNFKKEVKIPLSFESGYVFLQTDKPIYTPKQSVRLRVIPLNERTRPTDDQVKIQIKNPQGIIVKEINSNQKAGAPNKAFTSHVYQFPPYPMVGIWTIIALHGYQFQRNTSIQFELREYVLPTFVLKLSVPEVVLTNDETIVVNVSANYVYGRKVKGTATFKYGVRDETGKVLFFGVSPPVELDDGIANHWISTRELKDHKSIGWFPQIEGSYLVVEASVRDEASGNKEVIIDHKCRFSRSPFVISFKRSLRDFKPGLVSIVEVDIMYVNGRPAPGILTVISAVADNNGNVHINNPQATSDHYGRLSFEIHPEMHHKIMKITVKTADHRFGNGQAEANFMQEKFSSSSGGYIAISKRSNHTIQPNKMFAENVHFHPPEMANIYYIVVSKGQIVKMSKLPEGKFSVLRLEFEVTFKMAPSFRVVVFAHHGNDLIADSIKVDVSEQCHPNAEVVIKPDFRDPSPGSNGRILLNGFKNTFVGLLAVDEAVYALRNKDLLTRAKMFSTMKSHDLGCGPGGGKTTNAVLGNAGVVVVTNLYSPPEQSAFSTCEEKIRKKRELNTEYASNFNGSARDCCNLGMTKDVYGRSCQVRADIVKDFMKNETSDECSSVFLECCEFVHRVLGTVSDFMNFTANERARNADPNAVEPKFILEDEEDFWEEKLNVRKDFQETWIFEDVVIGAEHKKELLVNLPDSITTWVIQAVSVSHDWGMCVSIPKQVTSFKKIFLQLNLPYSVVRNEQIEVQVVVFNYGLQKLPVVVYMYGVKDLCSGAHQGEKSERKRIYVDSQSAESVSFPVIPLKEGDYELKVVALSTEGSDSIIRKLHVVAEGHTVEKDITVMLDPTNRQKRPKRATTAIRADYRDSIDVSKNLQLTSIMLALPQNFVPGTESCVISALGDEFGPTVQTCLQNPENLLKKSVGCGEQTMIFLAPTMYTMNYLKAKGKITPEIEAKGYDFIRQGYERELTFRKADGAYSAFVNRPPSTWLTAFVMKVFCQASKLIHIDEATMCSGIKWLISNQQRDGSFIDHHPVIHKDMMGGVQGLIPMTAFVLIALQECSCDNMKDLELARARSLQYLENHVAEVTEPLPVAIVSYVLALTGSELKNVAYDRLTALEQYNEDENTLHWGKGHGSHEVEITSYGLLTQLQYNYMDKSNSIVNWLNKLRLASGSFPSTQDTVIALQSLSEYEIASQKTAVNLVSNITSSNDKNLVHTMMFHDGNSLVLQQIKVDKVGGSIFVNTAGQGVGLMTVKLRYNVPSPPEKLCKFHLTVNVSAIKEEKVPRQQNVDLQPGRNDVFINLDPDLIRAVGSNIGKADVPLVKLQIDPRARPHNVEPKHRSLVGIQEVQLLKNEKNLKTKREAQPQNSIHTLKIEICTRYLGDHDADMTLIEAGIFTGFQPIKEDLEKLVQSNIDLVQKYEITSRGVVFYLEKAPKGIDYCFRFRVNREYIIGNTQSSIIKVYDYYNPNESCTVFYSPDNNSPMLHTICKNGICQCAEGGCPLEKPFRKLSRFEDFEAEELEIEQAMQERLRGIVCDDNDYAWTGKVVDKIKREAGFLHVTFEIKGVIKEGIEKSNMLLGDKRTLLARDNCENFIPEESKRYVIMGKDGQKYQDENGRSWYRYLLDRSSSIFSLETKRKSAESKTLLKAFKWLIGRKREELCIM